jgi:glycosyltransferase involved in cell wall biosynthesis
LKIVVNTRLLLKDKLEGIGRFTFETLKRITTSHPEHHFIFLFDRPYSDEFIFSENITPVILSPQARHPFLFYWWFEFSVHTILKDLDADLFLSPDGYLPLSSKTTSLAVIHDLSFEHYPKDFSWLVSKYYRHFFPKFARKADRIVTVSEFSKQDIINTYKIPSHKIDVVHNGVNTEFRPFTSENQIKIRALYSNGFPYFLFVGSLHPRKNIARLFTAFDQFKSQTDSDVKLVIVGARYRWSSEIKMSFDNMKHKEDVIFTGRLPETELPGIMASAFALVYVPYFEGFGIPILEAMKSGVPVITSNLTSMPEVSGDAAINVDPFSVESISSAMVKIEKDKKLREELIIKGKDRASKFSWDKAAEELWVSMEKLLINKA